MTATDTTLSISHPADPEQILPTDREDWLKLRLAHALGRRPAELFPWPSPSRREGVA